METMIVTGGAGFIGANFVRYALANTGSRIVVIDKLTYAGNECTLSDLASEPRFEFIKADVADRSAMESILREHRPVELVHFAAETHVDRAIDDPTPFVDTNIVGTFVLLETARQFLATVDATARSAFRFLNVSTDEVYGTLGETGFFRETTPYSPNSPYSASKAAADHMVRAYQETYGLGTITTNCSNNYGPYQFPEKLIPLTLLNAVEGKPLPIYGDGGNIRDWLYVEDHCAGIMQALKRGRPGEKYNIGGDNERTNLQVVDRICEVLEEELPAAENKALRERGISRYEELKTFVEDRPGHDRRYAIDASKIKRELGWAPAHNFEAGIASTVRWYLENHQWCDRVLADKYDRERLGLGERA
ncbi:MAG TPA: dTDP-glucose 4,6-dehydratase [Blastocatellia bacterium]|nr:dTDP-glucose 4,6-dehydratase [Blastocatellia bacterium]